MRTAAPRIVLDAEHLSIQRLAVETDHRSVLERLAQAEIPAAAIAAVAAAIVDQHAGADRVVEPAELYRQRALFEPGERIVRLPADVALLKRRLALLGEAGCDAGCIVTGRLRIDAARFAEESAAPQFRFQLCAELGAELGPVARAHVQKTVRFAEPRCVLAELCTDDHQLQIELRVVGVVQLVVGDRRRCKAPGADAKQRARKSAVHPGHAHHPPLVRTRATSERPRI